MGAGFKIQIVNASPYRLTRTYSNSYQMEWNPTEHVASNACEQFYGEFQETTFKHSIDDGADATYCLDGVARFAMKIHAKKKDVDGLPSPNPPSESGYGVLVEWENIPDGLAVYPPPDAANRSAVGWIHDGVVTIALGHFPGASQRRVPAYPTPRYGAGGLDDDLSALKPSVKHWAKNWMELYRPFLDRLKLTELTLPGTHDAGTYPAGGISQPWVQTQYLSLQQQLQQGIRALDIRLQVAARSGDSRFQFCHGDVSIDLSLVDCLKQVVAFLNETSNEVIVLDFHSFEQTWTERDLHDLAMLLQRVLGERLIPSSMQGKELGEILRGPGRVVVGMGKYSGGVPPAVLTWLQNNTVFWVNAVEQHWCGTSVTSWDHVKEYMSSELQKVAVPKDHLWALMAQYNYAVPSTGKPANVPVEISQFFAGEHGLRANIIDTDWWNRVNFGPFHGETSIANFSALINAVPLNILKAYRRANGLPLF